MEKIEKMSKDNMFIRSSDFFNSIQGQRLPYELISMVDNHIFTTSVTSLNNLLEVTPENIDNFLSTNIFEYNPNISNTAPPSGFLEEKMEKMITQYLHSLPVDEQIIVQSPYFFEYLSKSDDELISEISAKGLTLTDKHLRYSPLVTTKLNAIKFLIRNRIINEWRVTFNRWSPITSTYIKGKRYKQPKRNIDWNLIYSTLFMFPKEYIEAYPSLRKYSLGNQALILAQMIIRNIEIGPIDTFNGWKSKGYIINKGEKGIGMIQPKVVRIKNKTTLSTDKEDFTYTDFMFPKKWFAQSQTSANDLPPVNPRFDKHKAMKEYIYRRPESLIRNDQALIYPLDRGLSSFRVISMSEVDRLLKEKTLKEQISLITEQVIDILPSNIINSIKEVVIDLSLLSIGEISSTLGKSLHTLYNLPENVNHTIITNYVKNVLDYGY